MVIDGNQETTQNQGLVLFLSTFFAVDAGLLATWATPRGEHCCCSLLQRVSKAAAYKHAFLQEQVKCRQGHFLLNFSCVFAGHPLYQTFVPIVQSDQIQSAGQLIHLRCALPFEPCQILDSVSTSRCENQTLSHAH
jgi:hypothetical protein